VRGAFYRTDRDQQYVITVAGAHGKLAAASGDFLIIFASPAVTNDCAVPVVIAAAAQ
jgi:hypothetical protein